MLSLLLISVLQASSLDLELGTTIPTDLGPRLTFESNHFSTSLGFGLMPRAYVKLINSTAIAMEAYDEKTAQLIEDTLSSSMVGRLHVGYIPFLKRGFYISGGYGLITLAGTMESSNVISEATGIPVPGWFMSDYDYKINSTLHILEADIGWRFLIDQFVIRFAVSGFWTFAANSEVEPTYDPFLMDDTVQGWCDDSAQKLDTIYEDHVRSPSINVSFGWRF